jgi:hypothetical protein
MVAIIAICLGGMIIELAGVGRWDIHWTRAQ